MAKVVKYNFEYLIRCTDTKYFKPYKDDITFIAQDGKLTINGNELEGELFDGGDAKATNANFWSDHPYQPSPREVGAGGGGQNQPASFGGGGGSANPGSGGNAGTGNASGYGNGGGGSRSFPTASGSGSSGVMWIKVRTSNQ